jgi:hypothetical protein
VTLPRGLPSATLRLDGANGPPRFVLTGPGGLRIAHTGAAGEPARGRGFQIADVPGQPRTLVRLQRPSGGRYTLSPAAGTTVSRVAIARGLPDPSVRGTLRRGDDGGRVLDYRLRPITGQLVRFVEEGRGVRNILATTRKQRGVLRFAPASGPGGRRTVYAIVEQRGMPRAKLRIAGFTARSYPRPGRVREVRLRRRGSRLVVTWRPAHDAVRYAVAWALRDGRRQATTTRAHRLVIRNVPGIDAGRITVAALRRDNVAGPTIVKQLQAKPKRPKPTRRRHQR